MKKSIILGAMFVCLNIHSPIQAKVIVFNSPSITLTAQQPIKAIFTDSQGNTYQQTVYYNSVVGGVNIDNSSNYVSVYFPTIGSSYLWNNGYWVDKEGYYWSSGIRYQAGPSWHDHWNSHWNGRHGGHYDGESWHGHHNSWEVHGGSEHHEEHGGWEGRGGGEHHEGRGGWEGRGGGERHERRGGWEGRGGGERHERRGRR